MEKIGYNDIYSNIQKDFFEYIAINKKINLKMITEDTIKEVDNYIKILNHISKEILEESIKKRIKIIEWDFTTLLPINLSSFALFLTINEVLSKLSDLTFFNNVIRFMNVLFAIGIMIYLNKILIFFDRRKEELAFNNFVLNRINKLQINN